MLVVGLGGGCCIERGVRYSLCCKKSSSVEVPSVGVEIVEILHGGVGGDVELGTRTSKQILVFAFDPIPLNSISFHLCKHHSFHTSIIIIP